MALKDVPFHRELLEFIDERLTDHQRLYLKTFIDCDCNAAEAARQCGVCRANIRQAVKAAKKKAAEMGWSPKHDMTHTVPDGFHVKGVSSYYGKEGQLSGQWVKFYRDEAQFLQDVKDTIHEITADLPQIPPRDPLTHPLNQLLAVYPLGDPHIGMLSYGAETGQNWDLKIAEQVFLPVFDRLVKAAPQCDEALIIDLGDFWQADNYEGRTTRSGHKVDTDGRFSKMVKVGYRILRRMIESALDQHGIVNVMILPGNHDDVGSVFMRESLLHVYEHEPRVKVLDTPAVFQYMRWGNVLIGGHHGHTCKLPELPLVMATDRAKDWGECTKRYWYTGHIHHDSKKEYQGCIVESFRTITGPEAYSIEAGYRSGQDSKCIVLHKTRGEVERHTVDVDNVENQVSLGIGLPSRVRNP